MLKKIQWTLSIFSTPIIYCPYSISVCFLWPGTVHTVSGSVKATHVTDWHWNHCSMQVEQVFRSGETFMCPHRAGLSNKLGVMISFAFSAMWTCCNILACNDVQISTYELYSWSIAFGSDTLKACLTRLLIASQFKLTVIARMLNI